ncbi:MAG: hypothetical protein KJ057_16005 [Phycisphaerae bacterium]|nr:MAG: hypothetical protein F9K17_12695 [Phycisphaerae bacterium]MBE7456417.1 hypothetical protein [Planctomycetia bacterium]MCK6466194.1 hypothetical protein [Phycisphaerae bacterium]MCL4719975.1 hypothetical protein [Phycisphaerae bacterium]NUQ10241.1 hypothetical protein [Phycisphaerae bacterium]
MHQGSEGDDGVAATPCRGERGRVSRSTFGDAHDERCTMSDTHDIRTIRGSEDSIPETRFTNPQV